MTDPLRHIIREHRAGQPWGIYSVCSAHPRVLEAAMEQARMDNSVLLIESTSNQVDQFGGYTGLTPAGFVKLVRDLADRRNFPPQQIILGGDHLGPNVWQNEPAEKALAKARDLVAAYLEAGYRKIHLDTSMPCADDPGAPHRAPDARRIARRAADLCQVAENTHRAGPAPLYVIGTEVPTPGGAREDIGEVTPTAASDAEETLAVTREAFRERGLEAAWERVIAVVVQPGVEFSDNAVIEYRRKEAAGLSQLIERYDNLVYEAHSTDYQTPECLQKLVEDHFAILKVGPWLTFAFREAVFALAMIEAEWLAGRKGVKLSHLHRVVDTVMKENPQHWQKHYRGSDADQALARYYSYSDRIRYYWPHPAVRSALERLLDNLSAHPAPLTLLSQYLPRQYQAVREGLIDRSPAALIEHKIREVTAIYAAATRMGQKTAALYNA